ncbi:hypothetical protein R8Z50_34230 [Longispora sp. K20-0274]|uniref:hypothetical protein n=1 Tax=Longispora sp. K20-0274 TaxID=3088255 RepID=UPI003999B843
MTWREYATLAGQLEAHRGVQAARAAGHVSARTALGAELTALEELLAGQQDRLTELYDRFDLSEPVLSPQQAPQVTDLADALRRARDAAERSASQLTAVESAARRSPYLPHWSTNLRNALVYGCTSAAAFFVNVFAFLGTSGVGRLLVTLLFVALPFLAYGVGSSLIGVLFKPALGAKPPKTRPLGLAICLAPILPLCALWGISWTVGG